ncbi:MAG: hypothetical protein ACE5K2_07320 [Candidatus Zixiibacteriota bacterium]
MLDWILDNIKWVLPVVLAIIASAIKIIYTSRDKKQEQIKVIVQRYLDILDNKILGYPGIPGLIESGAIRLSKNKDLIKVCEIISQHGKPYPLPKYIWKYLREKELLKFVKWCANNSSHFFFNEQEFATLVQKYKGVNTYS